MGPTKCSSGQPSHQFASIVHLTRRRLNIALGVNLLFGNTKETVTMKRFNPTSTHPRRAAQAWQILVSAAMNRQTTTYRGLSVLMYGRPAQGVLDRILGHIAYFCLDNDLPVLTCIVVNQITGLPGADIPLSPRLQNSERERVFAENWYDIQPPTAKQLRAVQSARL